MAESNHSKNNAPVHHQNHHEAITPHIQHNEDNSRISGPTHADKIGRPDISNKNNK